MSYKFLLHKPMLITLHWYQPRWSSKATWFASLNICLLASLFYNSVHPDVHLSLPLEPLPCAHTASRLLAISPESVSHSTRHSFPLSFFLSSPPQSHQQLFALISAAHSQSAPLVSRGRKPCSLHTSGMQRHEHPNKR